ncbi:MAG: zinc-binding dehydrogenase [Flavobacteriales bacterium]|nr:zinc-binding dehydrogenase [Flavobacteriales bacterium]
MRAVTLIKYGDANQAFAIREVPQPTPADHEVLIKVSSFGLNYADVMARYGQYKDAPPLPAILGYEVAGTIEAVGKDVTTHNVGDQVMAFTRFGGYGEYAVADARGTAPIPTGFSMLEATALPTQYGTAHYCAYEMVNLFEGDHVLIHAAAGGVGTALIQLAKNKGCIIYGTAGSAEKLDYLRTMGVDFPINYRKTDFYNEIKSLRGNEGLDVIFDPIGGTNYKKSRKLLAHGGRIVSYGVSERSGKKGGILADLKLVFDFGFLHPIMFLLNSTGTIGVNMLRIGDHQPNTLKRTLKGVVQLSEDGVLKPHIGGTFPVDKIDEAHELLGSRNSIGKIVIEW